MWPSNIYNLFIKIIVFLLFVLDIVAEDEMMKKIVPTDQQSGKKFDIIYGLYHCKNQFVMKFLYGYRIHGVH
jgi:hypothetical protein